MDQVDHPSVDDQPLTDRQVRMLALEQRWWKYAGAKEATILDEFDVSPARYYQELDALIDLPAALEAEPTLVRRLQRLRDARRRQRTPRPVT
ncbi:DUF3263 domain-containing protein [Nocardioides sp. CPCC 205120]|uniref:DUF3263 domain-containing protein n=1 Tax=Nocardioides sp. CPCC 205120 TaxID=3406462 RepID=UPI003B5031A6